MLEILSLKIIVELLLIVFIECLIYSLLSQKNLKKKERKEHLKIFIKKINFKYHKIPYAAFLYLSHSFFLVEDDCHRVDAACGCCRLSKTFVLCRASPWCDIYLCEDDSNE